MKSVNDQTDQKNWGKVLKGEMDEERKELEEGKEEEKRKNKTQYRRNGGKEWKECETTYNKNGEKYVGILKWRENK